MRVSAQVIVVMLASAFAHAQEAVASRHDWNRIEYAPLVASWGVDKQARIALRPDAHGLRLDLMIATAEERAALPEKGELRARLHRDPQPTAFVDLDYLAGTGRGELWSMQNHYGHVFPWGEDRLAEAWLELHVGDRIYWLEIPYGFDRDPGGAIEGVIGKGGVPQLAAAMSELPEGAQIVPWQLVHYDVGEIQNGWRLSVLVSNPFDATTELVLYRDDGGVGKSIYLWDLREPLTEVTIATGDGHVRGHAMGLRLHSDWMRRSDSFQLFRNSSKGRCWGTMKVQVGKHEHELVLPSSMFRYMHGLAEPHHPARRKR